MAQMSMGDARAALTRMRPKDINLMQVQELLGELGLTFVLDDHSDFEIDNFAYRLQHLGRMLELLVDDRVRSGSFDNEMVDSER